MNKRVLIIDDDMDLCLLLGKLLTKNGYETEAAYTGNKGITRFSEKKIRCRYLRLSPWRYGRKACAHGTKES